MDFKNLMSLAGVGAVFGFLASCWQQVKAFYHRVVGLVVITVEIQDYNLSEAVVGHMANTCRRWGNYDRVYQAFHEFLRKPRRWGLVSAEVLGRKSILFWRGWIPIYLQVNSPQPQDSSNKPVAGEAKEGSTKLMFIRYTLSVEKFIKDATDFRNNLAWRMDDDDEKSDTYARHFIRRVPDYIIDGYIEPSSQGIGNNHRGLGIWRTGQFRPVGMETSDIGYAPMAGVSSLQNLVFPEEVRDLIREVGLWLKSRKWYAERGIPWRKGYLLYGQPGTGKSALARALAQDLDMPLWVYDLSELDNAKLVHAWSTMKHNVPCVALIEDIDNVFHGRKNVSRSHEDGMFSRMMQADHRKGDSPSEGKRQRPMGALSFDCLLNVLDGVESNEGIFTIITTNRLDKVDEALGVPAIRMENGHRVDAESDMISTRPGRIDRAIELTFITNDGKLKMAERIFKGCPDGMDEMEQWLADNPFRQETPAQFQERCAALALRYFWKKAVHACPR